MGQKVEFCGHIINYDVTSNSVSITPSLDKLQTVRDLQEPCIKSEAQSLEGFLSQLSDFMPEIKICCPAIKRLTSKFNTFEWQDVHRREFKLIKEKLLHVVPLTPVDTSSTLILHTEPALTV